MIIYLEIGYNIYSDTKIAEAVSSDTRPILLRSGRVFFVYKEDSIYNDDTLFDKTPYGRD